MCALSTASLGTYYVLIVMSQPKSVHDIETPSIASVLGNEASGIFDVIIKLSLTLRSNTVRSAHLIVLRVCLSPELQYGDLDMQLCEIILQAMR